MDMHALVGKNNKLNKATRHVTNKKSSPKPQFSLLQFALGSRSKPKVCRPFVD